MLLTSGRRGGEEGLAGTEHALTICGLRARTVNVPKERPVQTSAGEIRTALLVLIDLETEEGTTGRAYVRSYSTFAVEPLRQLVENLGATLDGAALAPLEIERKLQEMFRLLGPQGLTGIAASGIDMAAWDALARAHDLPLVELLGGVKKRVPAYGSLRSMHPESVSEEAGTPICIGENWWGPHDLQKSLEVGACDYGMPDAMKIGGVTGWVRAAALAEPSGLPLTSHVFPEVSAHLLAASPTAHRLEYLDHAGPILEKPIRIEEGQVCVPEGPGIGIEWDEPAVERFLIG